MTAAERDAARADAIRQRVAERFGTGTLRGAGAFKKEFDRRFRELKAEANRRLVAVGREGLTHEEETRVDLMANAVDAAIKAEGPRRGPYHLWSTSDPRHEFIYQRKTRIVLEGLENISHALFRIVSPYERRHRERQIRERDNTPTRDVPATDSEGDPITTNLEYHPINEGDLLADFHDEHRRGRHYTRAEIMALQPSAGTNDDTLAIRNPYTKQVLDRTQLQPYRAHLVPRAAGSGRSGPSAKLAKQLSELGIAPATYLKEARRRAKAHGYNPSALAFAADSVHKFQLTDPKGKIHKFGRAGYGDHQLWLASEKAGKAPKGKADKKRDTFRKSHLAMGGEWKKDDYSPNWLAIRVLW
jgi:hypothetical protein